MTTPRKNNTFTIIGAAVVAAATSLGAVQVRFMVSPPREDPWTGTDAARVNNQMQSELFRLSGKVDALESLIIEFSTSGPEEVRKALERQEALLRRIYERQTDVHQH